MDLDYSGDIMNRSSGGGNALLGLLAGSALNKDDDRGKTSTMMIVLAVVFFVIVFIIALVFLAMAFKDRGYDHRRDNTGTDIAALLAPMIAAKSMDCHGNDKGYDHDHLEIKNQIAHSEDRREISGIKSELGAVALMMQKTACDNEKDNLKEFGEIKSQLSAQSMALTQLLTKSNNQDIINGVIQQLMCGKPCVA